MCSHAASRDIEGQAGLVKRPRVNQKEIGLWSAEHEPNGSPPGLRVDVLRRRSRRRGAADGKAEHVHRLQEAEVVPEQILGRIDPNVCQAERERKVRAKADVLAKAFLALHFVVLELINGELGLQVREVERLVVGRCMAGGEDGERQAVEADEQARVRVDGFGAVGRGRPHGERDLAIGFEYVPRESLGVERGGVVMERPARVVHGDRRNGGVVDGGEAVVAKVAGELAGKLSVVGLGDQVEVRGIGMAADHGRRIAEMGKRGTGKSGVGGEREEIWYNTGRGNRSR